MREAENMKSRKLFLATSAGALLVTVVLGWILFGHGSLALGSQAAESSALDCLAPHLEVIPFPMPQKNPRTIAWDGIPLAVPDWWKPQLDAEQQTQYEKIGRDLEFSGAYDIQVFDNQVWIAHMGGVMRFDVTHNLIKTYQIAVNSPLGHYAFVALYYGKGELWAILTSGPEAALAQYDPNTDEFRIVHDKDGLLDQQPDPTIKDLPSVIGELSDRNLVFVLGWQIFSYNPANRQAKILLGSESGFHVDTIAISKDDKVWFTTVNDFVIRSLNPATGKIREYGEPASLLRDNAKQAGLAEKSSKAIAVDDQGRVWVGYFDRLEPKGFGRYEWQAVDRPTIFVDDTHIYATGDYAVYMYKWSPVISVARFSDGNMWFSTGVGVVQYNMAQDNWCWSATQPYPGDSFSRITEDEHGNIWMVNSYTNQIYKLER
jgi:streptogramin lyase